MRITPPMTDHRHLATAVQNLARAPFDFTVFRIALLGESRARRHQPVAAWDRGNVALLPWPTPTGPKDQSKITTPSAASPRAITTDKPSAQLENADLGIRPVAVAVGRALDPPQRVQFAAPLLDRKVGQRVHSAGRKVGHGHPGGKVKRSRVHYVVVGL